MSKKKIFIIAPDFYGIDKSICNAFKSLGFDIFLKNTRFNKVEAISLKLMNKFPIAKNILSQNVRFFLNKYYKRTFYCLECENTFVNLVKKRQKTSPCPNCEL